MIEREVLPGFSLHCLFEHRDVFIRTAGGCADNDGNPVCAVSLYGGVDLRFDLFERVPKQPVGAAAAVCGRAV